MIIKIKGDFSSGEDKYKVFLNNSAGNYKIIDATDNAIEFHTDFNCNRIKIQQIKPKSKRSFINWLIWAITFPIQGILYFFSFSSLLLNLSDVGKWEDNIFGYMLDAEFDIKNTTGDIVEINLIGSYYNMITETFELPKIVFRENYEVCNLKNDITKESTNVKYAFIGWIRAVISVCLTGLIIGILLGIIFRDNAVILTVCVLLALLCAVAGTVVFTREFIKYKSICNGR